LQRQGEPTTVSTVGTKRDHESDDEDPEGDIRNASIPSKKKYKPQLHSAMRINFRCKTGRAFGRNLRRERSFGLSINGSGQCTYRLADRTSDPEERIPFSVRSRTRTRKIRWIRLSISDPEIPEPKWVCSGRILWFRIES
jgi:hypothetical protein